MHDETRGAPESGGEATNRKAGRRMATTDDIDFSDILDVAALRAECDGLVEASWCRPDEIRADAARRP